MRLARQHQRIERAQHGLAAAVGLLGGLQHARFLDLVAHTQGLAAKALLVQGLAAAIAADDARRVLAEVDGRDLRLAQGLQFAAGRVCVAVDVDPQPQRGKGRVVLINGLVAIAVEPVQAVGCVAGVQVDPLAGCDAPIAIHVNHQHRLVGADPLALLEIAVAVDVDQGAGDARCSQCARGLTECV